jgi:transcriptional regulator with XRE-family HTH domain
MDKILAYNNFIIDAFNPVTLAEGIAGRLKRRRLELNLTRKALAEKSGVSQGSLKRFEDSHEISLKHLLLLAVVLDSTEEFENLFSKKQYSTIDEALNAAVSKNRKRGRRNV